MTSAASGGHGSERRCNRITFVPSLPRCADVVQSQTKNHNARQTYITPSTVKISIKIWYMIYNEIIEITKRIDLGQ